jgi:hypothetical protein
MSLVDTINAHSLARIGRTPDLDRPQTYNDKINWLKVHDQRHEQIAACDKIAVREMVAAVAGPDVLISTQPFPPMRFPCIAKASHDSGGNAVIDGAGQIAAAQVKLNRSLARTYGVEKGEWAYGFVPPAIIVEDLLASSVDYKFHCVHGEPRWVQVIWDRCRGYPREAIFMPDGSLTDLHMDEKMRHSPTAAIHPGTEAWTVLTMLASKLAAGWRYVRVDLYWSDGRAWFGELTFWPRAGCYRSRDEPLFGEMMDIDMTYRYPAIVP